ncbi:phosphatidylinositol-glycan-specific phospholipase D-like [Glandiceps talaboti]
MVSRGRSVVKNAFVYSFIFVIVITTCFGCGGITHTEIGHRAASYFQHKTGDTDYRKLIDKHKDAFEAGNPFPDTFYDSICHQGQFHDVSEDTHWSEFINATINHIRKKYPKPWTEETEKLVVFLLGFVSHDVADISWHSLGIDQGFLATMGKVNFYGSFEDAHDAGDPGGDVAAMFEFNMNYIHSLTEWYIPSQDLIEIFKEFYGKTIITPLILEECIALMYLARVGEKIIMSKLYPMYSSKSPFLMEQYQSFFLGGVDDMAVWSQNIWHNTIHMIEHGMQDCDVPHNPLYIRCNDTSLELTPQQRHPGRNPGLIKPPLGGIVSRDDIIITRSPRGVYFKPSNRLQMKLDNLLKDTQPKQKRVQADSLTKPDATYTVSSQTAHLGWSLATGDINNDDFMDLVIGAPGHSMDNNYQQGRVYIIHGSATGLPLVNKDLNHKAYMVLDGVKVNGKFGSAVQVVDMNCDGVNDLVISAPTVNSDKLTYNGEVYIYFGSAKGTFKTKPDITITCEGRQYCNLGVSLSVGDLNKDGFSDLVIGSPYAPTKDLKQNGMVNVLFASKNLKGGTILPVTDTNLTYVGNQSYSWFGYNVNVETVKLNSTEKAVWLLVSSPTWRVCALKKCKYSKNDTQSVGKLSIYDFSNELPKQPTSEITGEVDFQKLGASVTTGNPYNGKEDVLAVTDDTIGIQGKILGVSTTFKQAGRVTLRNVTSLSKSHTAFSGDRSYGRYGEKILLEDVTGDQIDDVIIGAPFRIDDLSEELYGGEEGRVYIYKGGQSLAMDDITRECGSKEPVVPCPAHKAYAEYGTDETGSRFGSNIAVLRHAKGNNLIVSAVHSNQGQRLSGAVHIFNIE